MGLMEDKTFSDISKGSKYRKQAFSYTAHTGFDTSVNPVPARIIVEISAFANPFPYEERTIAAFCNYIFEKAKVGRCDRDVSP